MLEKSFVFMMLLAASLVGMTNCRRCEYYFVTTELFCKYCGMRLRGSPANMEFKEKVRAKKTAAVNLSKKKKEVKYSANIKNDRKYF